MSQTLERVIKLVKNNDILISFHGYDELSEDDILIRDVLNSVEAAVVVEDYPDFEKGRVSWCCSLTAGRSQFMWYGVFRKGLPRQPFWSLRIDPTRIGGQVIF